MSAPTWIGVALLGGMGAVGRALVTHTITVRAGRAFPFGTLAVNVSGALVLGLLAGAAVGTTALHLVGTGLLGGFTTFSTWMYETHALLRRGSHRSAVANLAVSLVLGLGAAWLGREIGAQL